jgi:glycogen debranching enzyme
MEQSSPYAGTTPVASLAHTEGSVTLVEGQTFALSERTGDMMADFPQGLFLFDTRAVSQWELRVNGHRLVPLSVEMAGPFAATFVGHGAPAPGRADADLLVFRHRHVGHGMRDRLVVTNHGLERASVLVELFCEADFADLFEVKEGRVARRGEHIREVRDDSLVFGHRSESVTKRVEVTSTVPSAADPGSLVWRFELQPGASWDACIQVSVTLGGQQVTPRFSCGGADEESLPARRLADWRATLPTVVTDNVALSEAIRRSGEDLGALRIFDPDHPELPILAAGAPWFMTVFGRDSLLTAWMTLIADSSLAHGVLNTLARFQGTDVDPATEEEPGKILHEMRFGGAGGLALGGGDVYYGSIDATPLFVMLLSELRRWDPRDALVERLLPHADRALEWIERFGDRDGDGYVEYRRSTDRGLANQGWKDSWDAIRHADGVLADTPIALCEVQGYVYAAYVARAHLADESGDRPTAERYRARAGELKRRFNEDFWLEEHGRYALGLDGDKRPIAAQASNIGHCLWTGIVDADRASIVARDLMSPEMFSGFGIRTLGSSMPAFNPVSYHNGSVWPHDNALCAAGLSRYGFVEEAARVITAQLEVSRIHGGRLPELFAGFGRDQLGVPAAYPTSCSPQAWASAAPLLWLRTMLRLDPSAPQNQVWYDPRLPPEIRRLAVTGIRVADRHLSVTVDSDTVSVGGHGDMELIHRRRMQ